jgi:hypothetical protein
MDQDNNSPSDYQEPENRPSHFTPPEDETDTGFAPPPPPPSHGHPHEHHDFHPHHESPPPPPPAPFPEAMPTHHVPPHDFAQIPPLPPPAPTPPPPMPASVIPQPVVRVLSPRGVEYVFMAIALVTGAIGLISALLAIVNGNHSFAVLYFPLALLLIAVPVFSGLFLRLKQAELLDPSARLDASKRRTTQFLQISSFVICFFTLIGFLATIFAKVSGTYTGSIVKVILDVLVLLVVAGGILFYYWNDEHKKN